jgi:hypothetical protein
LVLAVPLETPEALEQILFLVLLLLREVVAGAMGLTQLLRAYLGVLVVVVPLTTTYFALERKAYQGRETLVAPACLEAQIIFLQAVAVALGRLEPDLLLPPSEEMVVQVLRRIFPELGLHTLAAEEAVVTITQQIMGTVE